MESSWSVRGMATWVHTKQLVERYREPVFRAAYLATRSTADAQEAAQDTFVKAYAALGRFSAGAPLRPWLMRIAVNESRNRRRAAGRREALALRAARERPSEGADPSPEAALLARERRRSCSRRSSGCARRTGS
jgi:RNA polymerase sigma factor (sigma-70 family)